MQSPEGVIVGHQTTETLLRQLTLMPVYQWRVRTFWRSNLLITIWILMSSSLNWNEMSSQIMRTHFIWRSSSSYSFLSSATETLFPELDTTGSYWFPWLVVSSIPSHAHMIKRHIEGATWSLPSYLVSMCSLWLPSEQIKKLLIPLCSRNANKPRSECLKKSIRRLS